MNPIKWLLSHPELKTTGIINKFTKKLEFDVHLKNQDLSSFLKEWKLCTAKEAEKLYYGKIYRIKNISPNHIILQTRKRGDTAYHYIDCKYDKHSSKIIMKIQAPNSGAYSYVGWALIAAIVVFILSNTSSLQFSINSLSILFLYAFIGISIGIYFLDASLSSAKIDIQREMHKITGLKPNNLL